MPRRSIPIATARIEELIDELRQNFTIVIVTHYMQQAARVSQHTAFLHLGELVEEGDDRDDLHQPEREAHAGLHHRPVRLTPQSARTEGSKIMTEHIAKAFDADLEDLAPHDRRDGRPCREADRRGRRCAGAARHRAGPQRHRGVDRTTRRAAAGDRGDARSSSSRGASRWRSTCARSSARCASPNDLERIGDLAKNIAKRALALGGEFHPHKVGRGVEHMSDLVLGAAQGRARRLCAPRRREGARDVWQRRRGDRRPLHLAVPRAPHLHDGRPAQHHVLHASAVLRQEHRAHRRPCDQHRRDHPLHRRRASRSPTSGRRATRSSFTAAPFRRA